MTASRYVYLDEPFSDQSKHILTNPLPSAGAKVGVAHAAHRQLHWNACRLRR